MNELQNLDTIKKKNLKGENLTTRRHLKVEKKTISIPKTDVESIELVNSILDKCNISIVGRRVTLTDIVLHSLRKLKDADFEIIKESTLTAEESAEKALSEFNIKNGTNLTLVELAIKQLKKEKKEILQ
jgi:hypothetical protein